VESRPTEEEKQIIAKLRDEHGDVACMLVLGSLVVVRRATAADLERYHSKTAKVMAQSASARGGGSGPSFGDAQRELALSSIVCPRELTEKQKLIELQPGLVSRAANAAEELASAGIVDIQGN
jgi:hypothetical protein